MKDKKNKVSLLEIDVHQGGDAHEEPWLVSYADMMTLLFGFFVLMYVFASARVQELSSGNSTGSGNVKQELSKYFGRDYVDPLESIERNFREDVLKKGLGDQVTVSRSDDGLIIIFQSTALFEVGKAKLEGEAVQVLTILGNLLLEKKEPLKVRVEGHTDDSPIKSETFPSNWELSAGRSATVVRLFESLGFKSTSLVAIGYGANRPAMPNRDSQGIAIPTNQARNRRVVVNILPDLDAQSPKAQ